MGAVDISPAQDGGVLKEILKEGKGDEIPTAGSYVTVHYTGTLLDGTKFDSSVDRNEPFRFKLKEGTIIKAWDIGVATMKKGEIAMLTCASEYAYGKDGSPPKIPPNATLKFEIEVIDWEAEDLSPNKDGSIQRYLISAGEGSRTPDVGLLVNVHLIGKYDGRVFEDRDVKFSLGEGEDCGIIDGVEKVLKSFKKGEKSRLIIKSKYAFKAEGKPEFNIPPNATVEYIVHLKDFEIDLESWVLTNNERLAKVDIFKEKGTNYFKANKYSLAIKMYETGISFLEMFDDLNADLVLIKSEFDSLFLSVHLNLALCYLKTEQYVEAKDSCIKALKLSPQNEKALFRKGQAYLGLAAPEVAIKCFQQVLNVEPKNAAAAKQVAICNNLIKKELAKERSLYANMFDKFAQEDKQKEEEKMRDLPDVMRGTLGEWGQEERPGGRDATAFEKENPNILMLNANGTGEFQNM